MLQCGWRMSGLSLSQPQILYWDARVCPPREFQAETDVIQRCAALSVHNGRVILQCGFLPAANAGTCAAPFLLRMQACQAAVVQHWQQALDAQVLNAGGACLDYLSVSINTLCWDAAICP